MALDKSNWNLSSPFSVTASGSEYKFFYDSGRTYGDPQYCYPPEFEIEDYIDGGITYYYNGEACADVSYPMDKLGMDDECDGYIIGPEGSFQDEAEMLVVDMNDSFTAIEVHGFFTEDDDENLFLEAESWEDVFCAGDFEGWGVEIRAGVLPDFQEIKSKRR